VIFLVFPCSLGYSLGVLLRICEFSKAIQLFGNLTAEAAVDWWPETTQYLGPICWGSLADVFDAAAAVAVAVGCTLGVWHCSSSGHRGRSDVSSPFSEAGAR
jgi:hypothetical protein